MQAAQQAVRGPAAPLFVGHVGRRTICATRRDGFIALVISLVCFVAFNANLRSIPAADTYGARYLPFTMLRDGNLSLDAIARHVAQGRPLPSEHVGADSAWWIRIGRNDKLVSMYPILVPIVVAPLYAPAVLYAGRHDWDPQLLDHAARIMEKFSASIIAALATVLVYFLMRRRSEPSSAAFLALMFAFGTTTWTISSQALWPHGLAQLLVAGTLLLVTGPCTPTRTVLAGVLCALIACNRPPDAILAAGLGLYGIWWSRHLTWVLIVAAVVPVATLLAYNTGVVGHIIGGYGLVNPETVQNFYDNDVFTGVAGLLFSPTRGLFVFSPFLLCLFFCLPLGLRDRRARPLTIVCATAATLQVLFYGLGDWRQGVCFGPRWLSDALPMLFWMLPPIWDGLQRRGRALFCAACLVAVAIQGIGAFWYTGTSDAAIFAANPSAKMRAAWDIRNAPFVAGLQNPLAPRDLLVELRGNIDLITMGDQPGAASHPHFEVQGWALSGARTPTQVVLMIDGRGIVGTSTFFERPDVVEALGVSAASGWKLTFSGSGLKPGEHRLAILVRAGVGAEPRLLKAATFTIESEESRQERELAKAAKLAIERIAALQQPDGYWLTSFTDSQRFERPQPEMNTFLNAMLIDLLAPIADRVGLADHVRRTRTFLTSQIEPGGLVRYHGLPDAKTIGQLGCAITPDADDTALAWRIAPRRDRAGLDEALATLKHYRTSDGFYRTWLAPQERYQCIDQGRDPNPADIAIQIHVLMFLHGVDPPAAKILCAALQAGLSADALWVYYRLAPLIVALRDIDLNEMGCPVDLRYPKLPGELDNQGMWLGLIQSLTGKKLSEPTPTSVANTSTLLSEIAASNFVRVGQHPPLLYHNDLSAKVKRFYWSEEFGYALWLRAYLARDVAPREQQ